MGTAEDQGLLRGLIVRHQTSARVASAGELHPDAALGNLDRLLHEHDVTGVAHAGLVGDVFDDLGLLLDFSGVAARRVI